MLSHRVTQSFCPECYAKIPAKVYISDGSVYMDKTCAEHGHFHAMVERCADWWMACQNLGCTNIYDGYMVDVTDRCNIKCKYCYHGAGQKDRPVDEVIAEALAHKHLAPIILTGGEPTEHSQLHEIVAGLNGVETWVLTNGINLCDEGYLDSLHNAGLDHDGALLVGLSFHRESGGKDREFLELCRRKSLKVPTAFYVIDKLDQIDEALAVTEEYQDVLMSMRIKAASNLWSESGAENKIFTSDMLKYLYAKGETTILADKNNKTSFANVMHKGHFLMLVSWYDAANVDLGDIDCGPHYAAKDGTVNNLVTTALVNEGITKGWLNGEAV